MQYAAYHRQLFGQKGGCVRHGLCDFKQCERVDSRVGSHDDVLQFKGRQRQIPELFGVCDQQDGWGPNSFHVAYPGT